MGLLVFLPLLRLGGTLAGFRLAPELLMRPFGEWDLVLFGAGMHRWLLLASALPAIGLTVFFFASKGPAADRRRLRARYGRALAQMAMVGGAAFVGGAFLARVWRR